MARSKKGRPRAAVAGLALAPAVIMMRLPILAAEAQAASGPGTETLRAASEKAAAMAEGVVAAQVSLMRSMAAFWPEMISGKVPSLLTGAAIGRSVDAALGPARKRVGANYRRLGKRP